MPRTEVTIATRDGACPAWVFTPAEGSAPWPAVIFFMDGLGIRPALWDMAQQLADGGYLVLLPDLYYRSGRYAPLVPAEVFAKPDGFAPLMALIRGLDRDKKISDSGAFIDYLATRGDVAGERYAATGYCMGGNISLTAAGAFPDRLSAVASFHGGSLATGQPDSPHLFIQGFQGLVYVAGADQDAHFSAEQAALLDETLTDAGIGHVVEIYPGALHGYAVPDVPAYDAAAAARHWRELFALLMRANQKS